MRQLLKQNNYDLINEIKKIEFALGEKEPILPPELKNYYEWLMLNCTALKDQLNQNLADIAQNKENILGDILSYTNVVTRTVYKLNYYFLNPILRVSGSDRLCLKILDWLHRQHPESEDHLFAISDGHGSFASIPYPPEPTIYFVPPSSHKRLLYLPLLFHEFGHLLYALHKAEMDCLVKELQKDIVQILEPSIHRNDKYSEEDNKWRKIISETWYEWTQEIFCDAVGIIIGGLRFSTFILYVFQNARKGGVSAFQGIFSQTQYPVTWIRIKILANRAASMGLTDVAAELETSWMKIAGQLEITEDYFGFYTQDFLTIIQQKIDDMLVEANPRQCLKCEVEASQNTTEKFIPNKIG